MLDALIYGALILICVTTGAAGGPLFFGLAALFGCMFLVNIVNQGKGG